MSPKNSTQAVVHMMKKTSCHRIISQEMFIPLVTSVKAELSDTGWNIVYTELPSLSSIFPTLGGSIDTKVTPFPPPAQPHKKDDIVFYLHSSGSTGFPKPIAQRQVNILQWCTSCKSISRQSRQGWANQRYYT